MYTERKFNKIKRNEPNKKGSQNVRKDIEKLEKCTEREPMTMKYEIGEQGILCR